MLLKITGLKKFTLSELDVATDNFSLEKQIGIGAFSIVYKVMLCSWPTFAFNRSRLKHLLLYSEKY